MRNEEQQVAQLEALLGYKYQVLRRIGGGGMAQVFLARHRFHGGAFAVKVLAEYLAQDPQIVARFEQEARTSASLSGHPNIVPIFDIGHGDGLHYLIMQYISGEDMASYLRRQQRLTPADAANVVAQTAEALAWSESKRVVHRDLKPANMLLDSTGRIMVLDFGISKITDIADGLTRPGESLGTPYYMSPEQIRGEGCDVRSDLYSLGVVFFELLTGRRPFDNESSTAIQMAHLATPAPSLSGFDAELPAVCDQLIQRLMQKRREDRFQSPQALLEELRAQGAIAGPGLLRPQLNPLLEAALLQPVSPPPAEAIASATPVTPVPFVSPVTPVATPAIAPPVAPPVAPKTPAQMPSMDLVPAPAAVVERAAPAEPPAAPKRRGRRKFVWISAAAVAVVAGLLLYFVLVPLGPPPVLQDAHGRMLFVPPGKFVFGDDSPNSPRPREMKSLPGFYIDETEVSNKEYKRFVEATGYPSPRSADYLTRPNFPVSGVTFDDAKAYAQWANKRLPTEEEWEKAARGKDGLTYPWGQDPWTDGVPTTLQRVDSFPDRKSPYGALNMAGNVFEWTNTNFPAGDRERADMRSLLGNVAFSGTWYTIKGGSFSPRGDIFFACYLRRGFPADQTSPMIGFRCVRAVPRFMRLLQLYFSRR